MNSYRIHKLFGSVFSFPLQAIPNPSANPESPNQQYGKIYGQKRR